jgi:cytidine deaminase
MRSAEDWEPLVAAAAAVRRRAHAPYSGFAVGAALRAADGSVHVGCNVENGSWGLTVCAERVALASAVAAGAVAAGARPPAAIVVVADHDPPARPCGMCLQSLAEFAADLPILLVNLAGERETFRLRELLPQPFRFETGELP